MWNFSRIHNSKRMDCSGLSISASFGSYQVQGSICFQSMAMGGKLLFLILSIFFGIKFPGFNYYFFFSFFFFFSKWKGARIACWVQKFHGIWWRCETLCGGSFCQASNGYFCDVPHRIGEKVPGAIYVEVPFNQVDAF